MTGDVARALTFDRDDELRNDGEDLVAPVFQHVVDSLPSEKLVGKRHFTEPVEKQRQVVVVIQLLNFYLKGEREETPRENDVRQSGRARCDAVADRTGRGSRTPGGSYGPVSPGARAMPSRLCLPPVSLQSWTFKS